eukprot:scaffold30086_cov25-Tisochrysis_lutea.AAC.1
MHSDELAGIVYTCLHTCQYRLEHRLLEMTKGLEQAENEEDEEVLHSVAQRWTTPPPKWACFLRAPSISGPQPGTLKLGAMCLISRCANPSVGPPYLITHRTKMKNCLICGALVQRKYHCKRNEAKKPGVW